MKKPREFKSIILLTFIAIAIVSLLSSINGYLNPSANGTPPHAYTASYQPATYGIPEQVAGYSILLVKTSENTRCLPAGMMELTIMPVHPDPHNSLAPADTNGNFFAEIQKLPVSSQFEVSALFVEHHTWNRQKMIESNEAINASLAGGCVSSGGPIIVITDTPSPDLS